MNRILAVAVSASVVLSLGAGTGTNASAEDPAPAETPATAPALQSISDNMDVGLEYTLTVDGQVVDTTEGRDTFHYTHGQQQVIPGLEKALTGLKVGDSKELTIAPAEAYGELDPAAVVELPKSQLPQDVTPEVGMVLQGVTPDGQNFQARVKEVKPENITLDLNHPLAGKTLNFKVKVIEINPAKVQ